MSRLPGPIIIEISLELLPSQLPSSQSAVPIDSWDCLCERKIELLPFELPFRWPLTDTRHLDDCVDSSASASPSSFLIGCPGAANLTTNLNHVWMCEVVCECVCKHLENCPQSCLSHTQEVQRREETESTSQELQPPFVSCWAEWHWRHTVHRDDNNTYVSAFRPSGPHFADKHYPYHHENISFQPFIPMFTTLLVFVASLANI